MEDICHENETTVRLSPRPVTTFGVEFVTEGYEQPPHRHREAQFLLAMRGLITFEVEAGLWMVPPHCALWIPGGMEHSVRGIGSLEVYAIFVEPAAAQQLPSTCCTMAVSPLLRELVMSASHLPVLYDETGPSGRLIQILLDQLAIAPVEALHLPLPADPRLRKIADTLINAPADRATSARWARSVGMSERALFRLVQEQTGMSFGRWRQQFQIMFALERLTRGSSVQAVALELGYENSSAFITMFKKALGKPPATYFAAKHRQSGR